MIPDPQQRVTGRGKRSARRAASRAGLWFVAFSAGSAAWLASAEMTPQEMVMSWLIASICVVSSAARFLRALLAARRA